MDLEEKFKLLKSLRIIDILSNFKFNNNEEILIKIASLSNSVCLQLLEIFVGLGVDDTQKSQESLAIIEQFLPFLLKCFSLDAKVSSEVIEFLQEYTVIISSKTMNSSQVQQMGLMLKLVKEKSKFPNNFRYDPLQQDEEEGDFILYRQDLFALFKGIGRKQKDFVIGFMRSLITNLFNNLQTLEFQEIEADLSLFFHLGEAIPEEITKEKLFYETLEAVVKSPISKHKHQCVQLIYFEVISKYAKLFLINEKLIPLALESFIDSRGMRNGNPTIRSRSNFLFKKFVSTLESHLFLYAEQLFEYTKPFLEFKIPSSKDEDISEDDQMFIYESLGMVLASEKLDQQKRIDLMKKLLSPILSQINEILSKELYKKDTREQPIFSNLLSREICAIGHLSKGFHSGKITKETFEMFKNLIIVVTQVFKVLPHNTNIRNKMRFVLQRMIEILGEEVIEIFKTVFIDLFSLSNEPDEVSSVVTLVTHLISKTKMKSLDTIDELFTPLIQKIFKLINNGNYQQDSKSEEVRLQISLHKEYFSLISTIITQLDCRVFTTQKHQHEIFSIVETLIQGIKHKNLHVRAKILTI